MMRVAPSILFSVDWETFVCSGAKTHVRVTKSIRRSFRTYLFFTIFWSYFLLLFFFLFIAVQLSERSRRRRNLRSDNGRKKVSAGRRGGQTTRTPEHCHQTAHRTTTVSTVNTYIYYKLYLCIREFYMPARTIIIFLYHSIRSIY